MFVEVYLKKKTYAETTLHNTQFELFARYMLKYRDIILLTNLRRDFFFHFQIKLAHKAQSHACTYFQTKWI